MTMIALVFSHDFCVIAADRTVGNLNVHCLIPTKDEATKIKICRNTTMPFVATGAGFADAIEALPDFLNENIDSPIRLVALAQNLATNMKSKIPEDLWSQTHTTSCFLALTSDNQFFVHSLYLNDETVLFSGIGPSRSVILAGFCESGHQVRKEYWQHALTEAILPTEKSNQTPSERLNRVLQILTYAFDECASFNQFVSGDFDFCVITKYSGINPLNCLPDCVLFSQ